MNTIVKIEPFSNTWFTGIFSVFLLSILIIQVAIRVPPDKRKILSIALGVLLISRELWKNWYIYELGIWEFKTALPLHLCGISALMAGAMLFKTKQKGFEFLALMSFSGALHALLTPQLNHGAATPQIIEYYIGHGGVMLVPFYLIIVDGYRIKKGSWKNVFLHCQILLLCVGMINFILEANYMYLCAPPVVNNPLIIGSWPWYLLGLEVFGLVHILLLYFLFRKFKPLPY
jgi:hypothetical integral membrane protein (TIGR02206 family)